MWESLFPLPPHKAALLNKTKEIYYSYPLASQTITKTDQYRLNLRDNSYGGIS